MCECESSKKRDPANYSTPTVVNILYLGGMHGIHCGNILILSHSFKHTHTRKSKQTENIIQDNDASGLLDCVGGEK